MGAGATNTRQCSFCQKSQREVYMLVAGPKECICDQCIEVCAEIVLEKPQTEMPLARAYLAFRAIEALGTTDLTGTEVLERAKLIGEGAHMPATARELCEQLAGVCTDSVAIQLKKTKLEMLRILNETTEMDARHRQESAVLQQQLRRLTEKKERLLGLLSRQAPQEEVLP